MRNRKVLSALRFRLEGLGRYERWISEADAGCFSDPPCQAALPQFTHVKTRVTPIERTKNPEQSLTPEPEIPETQTPKS